jgi:hypothetical protein
VAKAHAQEWKKGRQKELKSGFYGHCKIFINSRNVKVLALNHRCISYSSARRVAKEYYFAIEENKGIFHKKVSLMESQINEEKCFGCLLFLRY